jgi:hypothetical protein
VRTLGLEGVTARALIDELRTERRRESDEGAVLVLLVCCYILLHYLVSAGETDSNIHRIFSSARVIEIDSAGVIVTKITR